MEKINKNNFDQFTKKTIKIIEPKIKEILDIYVDKIIDNRHKGKGSTFYIELPLEKV